MSFFSSADQLLTFGQSIIYSVLGFESTKQLKTYLYVKPKGIQDVSIFRNALCVLDVKCLNDNKWNNYCPLVLDMGCCDIK